MYLISNFQSLEIRICSVHINQNDNFAVVIAIYYNFVILYIMDVSKNSLAEIRSMLIVDWQRKFWPYEHDVSWDEVLNYLIHADFVMYLWSSLWCICKWSAESSIDVIRRFKMKCDLFLLILYLVFCLILYVGINLMPLLIIGKEREREKKKRKRFVYMAMN